MFESEEILRQRIAENIAYYRRQNGDTQADLAEKLNYSDKSVSKWERGDGTPDVFILSKIADLYGVTVQDLLRTKKVPKSHSRHVLITLLSIGLVWLTAAVLFCGAKILGVLPERAWLLFIFAIPVSGIVWEVFSSLWWGLLQQALSGSLIIWGVGLSLVLAIRLESVVWLLIICAVLQVLLILFYILKYQSRKRRV